MKKWFAYGAIFFTAYVFFLLATVPATTVLAQVKLPQGIAVSGVDGTIWHAHAEQVANAQMQINNIDARLSFWSLLSFNPSLTLTFGGGLLEGPQGQATVSGLFSELSVYGAQVKMAANDIAQQLPLPIEMLAGGQVTANIAQYVAGNKGCQAFNGNIVWQQAEITALDQRVALGPLAAKLSCDNGAIAAVLDEKNDLGLTFSAYLRANGRVSGNGYLQPGDKFPAPLTNVLPFIGRADNQGRYRLQLP